MPRAVELRLEGVNRRHFGPATTQTALPLTAAIDRSLGRQAFSSASAQLDREHRSFRQLLHHGATRGDDHQGVFEPHHAGERRRDEFADAVAEHGGWLKAQAPP